MGRTLCLGVAVAGGLAALAWTALPAGAAKAPAAGKVVVLECPAVHGPRWSYPGTISMSSRLYESFATGYDCKKAAAWTRKLSALTIPHPQTGHSRVLRGAPGFTCWGYPDKHGQAYAGVCRKGTSTVEFGWNVNVLSGASDQVVSAEDVGRQQLGGSDASTLLHQLGGNRYRLDIVNTSGVGYITRFVWKAPAGWKLTALKSSTVGTCKLASASTIACTGTLRPPTCLCTESGGRSSIVFTAKAKLFSVVNGYRVYNAPTGGEFHIAAMRPVPYLVPSTPDQARRHHNL